MVLIGLFHNEEEEKNQRWVFSLSGSIKNEGRYLYGIGDGYRSSEEIFTDSVFTLEGGGYAWWGTCPVIIVYLISIDL